MREVLLAAIAVADQSDVLAGRVPLGRFRGADPFAGTRELAAGVRVARGARVDPRARLAAPALVLDRAEVGADAEVGPSAVVGAGARIGPGAVVRDAIVWEGTGIAAGERVVGAIAAGDDRIGPG